MNGTENAGRTTAALERLRHGSRWFVGVVARWRTYYSLAYLLLAFPFGIAYFTFLVTGFAVSLSLVILLVGIPMLLFVFFLVIELTALERRLAELVLDVEIPTAEPPSTPRERLRRLVLATGPWQGLVYLFSKFFLGIAAFVAVVVGLTFTYSLVTAPLHYREAAVGIHLADPIEFVPAVSYQHDGWVVDVVSPVTLELAEGELIAIYTDTIWAALVVSAIGVVVGLVVLHLFNALAWCYAKYAQLLLRGTQPSVLEELHGE